MKQYRKMTPKAIVELAAPPSWAAAVCPVFVGTALAYALEGAVNLLFSFLLLCIAILMQSAVNTINDYFDFVKGTDTAANCVDVNDASIIYNQINPLSALFAGLAMLGLAGLVGLYLIIMTGLTLLWIGLAGVAAIALYSAGPLPISYTPLGEAVSGFVMGGLITYATYFALTLSGDWLIFYFAAPTILTIGLIMMTNNTCDISRDIEACRYTLPVLLGKKRSSFLLAAAYILVFFTVAHLAFWEFRWGSLVLPLLAFRIYPGIKTMFGLDFNHLNRIIAMKTTVKLAYQINFYYTLIILLGAWIGG